MSRVHYFLYKSIALTLCYDFYERTALAQAPEKKGLLPILHGFQYVGQYNTDNEKKKVKKLCKNAPYLHILSTKMTDY